MGVGSNVTQPFSGPHQASTHACTLLPAHEHVTPERADLAAEETGHETRGDADRAEEERHGARVRLAVARASRRDEVLERRSGPRGVRSSW